MNMENILSKKHIQNVLKEKVKNIIKNNSKYMINLFKKPLSNGDKIKITSLPYNNGFPNKNVYIGSEGIVEDLSEDKKSFALNMGGSTLIVTGKYKFKYI